MNRNGIRGLSVALLAAACATLVSVSVVSAQQAEANKPADALGWMQGEWEGEGWIIDRGGERRIFSVDESVRPAAQGHVLQIHGVGRSDGRIIHDAAGFVTASADGFEMRAVNMYGQALTAPMQVTESGFAWQLPMEDYGRVEYVAEYDGEHWIETGSWCPNGGECMQNFRMQLSRTGVAD